jgi:hypothetical protein
MGRPPSKSGGAAFRRLHRRLLRPVFTNAVINNVTAASTATPSTNDQYVRRIPICSFVMAVVGFALLLFMLVNASSMFEFHIIVAIVVMLNILELIMKLLPNFPTLVMAAKLRKRLP